MKILQTVVSLLYLIFDVIYCKMKGSCSILTVTAVHFETYLNVCKL